jgi:acetyl-CoA carboxylase biotin carboxylase subunit
MFSKVLIANRGEIAVRVIRACRNLGVGTVAVYSDADASALHVKLADEAIRIGPPAPAKSYLDIDSIVSAALQRGADGIHPGYGFLAENSDFAAACVKAGVKFIGPSFSTLAIAGNKSESKRLARSKGVPVIPGTDRVVEGVEDAKKAADSLGYPVLLKSVYGGGGRGIREVASEAEFVDAFERVVTEARGAFGRARVYIEKLIKPVRHIEVQILADGRGKTIYLGERECSIQRRHQKLVELAPSPGVSEDAREQVGNYAVRVAEAVHYENAGTIEFLMDSEGRFYFMEVNSRLQVEHPVTEMVTGIDLVREQLVIASTGTLTLSQGEVRRHGAAIECRINAEDPLADFAPSAGTVQRVHLPGGPGVRVDTALYDGCAVPEYYDSLVAKLIVHGADLEDARTRMVTALSEFSITGIQTTIPFHSALVQSQAFAGHDFSTDFLDRTRIVEQMQRAAAEKRKRLEEIGVVVGAAILTKGLHKKLEFEDRAGSGSEWRAAQKAGEARFFDQT